MKIVLKNIAVFLMFCAALSAGLYGVMLPNNPQVSAVSSMQIAPYPDGLSFFQDYRRLYYRFSPFNDYWIDQRNNRSSFISVPEIENRWYTTDLAKTHAENIGRTIYSYITGGSPSITFTTPGITAHYQSVVNANTTVIYRTITFADTVNAARTGMTISYNGDDIVFDSAQNAYNYWDTRDLDSVTISSGITLTPKTDRLHISIPEKVVYITNPRAAFVIIVRAQPNQELRVNRDARLIEVEEIVQPGSSYKTSMTVEIAHNPQEVL